MRKAMKLRDWAGFRTVSSKFMRRMRKIEDLTLPPTFMEVNTIFSKKTTFFCLSTMKAECVEAIQLEASHFASSLPKYTFLLSTTLRRFRILKFCLIFRRIMVKLWNFSLRSQSKTQKVSTLYHSVKNMFFQLSRMQLLSMQKGNTTCKLSK